MPSFVYAASIISDPGQPETCHTGDGDVFITKVVPSTLAAPGSPARNKAISVHEDGRQPGMPEDECVGQAKLPDKRAQLSVAIDKLYNAKFLNCQGPRVVPTKSNIDVACMTNNFGRHSNRFPVTDESRRFYNIFCALGHGKWKWYVDLFLCNFLLFLNLLIDVKFFLAVMLLYSFTRLVLVLIPLDSPLNLMVTVTNFLLLAIAESFLKIVTQEFPRSIISILKLGYKDSTSSLFFVHFFVFQNCMRAYLFEVLSLLSLCFCRILCCLTTVRLMLVM